MTAAGRNQKSERRANLSSHRGTKQITESLKFAFGNFSTEVWSFSEEEFHSLKSSLVLLVPEDLKRWLPGVLERIYSDAQKDERLVAFDDLIIYLLDGLYLGRSEGDRAYMQPRQAELFVGFSAREAAGIVKWLEAVEEFSFVQICPADYESALRFWRGKAAN